MAPNELRKMMIAQEYEENWENMSSSETIEDIDRTTFEVINKGEQDSLEIDFTFTME